MIKNLLDKLFFACGVIVFLQLPHFIDQYTQRMGGYAASQKQQIKEYQNIADLHFDGDLSTYASHLANNKDPIIAASAGMITENVKTSQDITKDLEVFENEPLWYQMPYFLSHVKVNLARGTLQNFAPGVPINLWAWGYGLLGGVLFSLLFNGATQTPKLVKKKLMRAKEEPNN